MTRNITFYIFILATMICSCNHRSDDTLRRAEKLLATHPDSAIIVLNRAAPTVGSYSRHNQMRYLLLRTEALNKTFARLDTVSYFERVLDYFDRHGSKVERIRANYIAGCICRDKGNSPLALQYYNDAVNLADTTRTDCDFALLSRIYGQMADIFDKQRYPQKELEMMDKVAYCALKAKDTLVYIENIVYTGGAYHMLGNKAKSLQLVRKGYNEYKRIGRNDLAASTLILFADHYLKTDSIDKAKHAIDEYRNKSGMFDKNGEIRPGCEIFYFYLGRYYEKTADNDSALWYYRKLIHFNKDISNLENGFKGLLSVYQRLHQSDSIAKYANLYAVANDSANFKNSADEISRTQALYDYSENQRIANEKTEEAAHLQKIIYVSLFIILILSIAIYLYLRWSKTKSLRHIMKMNQLYSDILIKYDISVNELNSFRRDQKKFEKDKLAEIEFLRKQLLLYKGCDSDTEKVGFEHSLLNHYTVQTLHKYAAKGKTPSDIEWTSLINIVNKLLPDFIKTLNNKEKSLSDKELKVCILTKLNFSPSEIGVLLDLTKQSISNFRTSINRKLFGETGTKSFDSNIHRL